jgi:hypothetical protein
VLHVHWRPLRASGPYRMTTLPAIVYTSRGLAPKSARPEDGGQRDLRAGLYRNFGTPFFWCTSYDNRCGLLLLSMPESGGIPPASHLSHFHETLAA